MLSKLKHNNRGDTIVEVMIVLAVLGLAIGISYATANRSLLNARQAQENSQATQHAQSQVEALRRLSSSTTPNIFQLGGSFCLIPTGNPTNPYSRQPTDDTNKAACTASGSVPYWTSITYTNPATAPDTFTVKVTWPDVIGQGDDTVTMIYRVHKSTP